MLSISTNEGAIKAMSESLKRLENNTRGLTKYWPYAVIAVREIVSEAFHTEGGSTKQGRWPALSPKYAAWKAKHYPGARILERTGDLRASLIGGPGGSVTMTPTKLTIESHVPYGGYHQRGIGQKRRSPWAPTDKDVSRIVAAVSRQIRKDSQLLVGV